jgi:hypothetical protein
MELPFPGGNGVVKLSKIRVRFYGIIYVSKEKLKEGVVFDTSFVFSILVYSSLLAMPIAHSGISFTYSLNILPSVILKRS